MELDTSVPTEAVAGEPDEGDEDFSMEEILTFVEDLVGVRGYILTFEPVLGVGA